jgi:cell division transport system permease protein
VDRQLHDLFAEALADEPVAPPGDLARDAMAPGVRLRRRRRLLGSGGVVGGLAVAAAAVVQLAAPPAPQPAPAAADCTAAAVFLREDVTNAQRDAVRAALAHDPVVQTFAHQSREEAFERFEQLWRDEPDAVRSVGPLTLPESFRVQLTGPADFAAFEAAFAGRGGVDTVVGGCR